MVFGFREIVKQIVNYPDAKKLNHKAVERAFSDGRINLIERLDLLSLLGYCQLIFLTRHGQTHWNSLDKCQTWSNNPETYLTPVGKKDAKKKGRMIRKKKIDYAIHSALHRAHQTCAIMLHSANKGKLPIMQDARLNDGNLSYMDGITSKEFKENYPVQAEARSKDKWNYRLPDIEGFPHAESMQDAFERITPLLQDILNKRQNVLLVGHRSINRVILYFFLHESKYNITKSNIVNVKIPNEGIYEIALLPNGEKYLLHNLDEKHWEEGLMFEKK